MSEVIRRQRIVETTSISEVVGEYFPLREDASGLHALRPFHQSRRPVTYSHAR